MPILYLARTYVLCPKLLQLADATAADTAAKRLLIGTTANDDASLWRDIIEAKIQLARADI